MSPCGDEAEVQSVSQVSCPIVSSAAATATATVPQRSLCHCGMLRNAAEDHHEVSRTDPLAPSRLRLHPRSIRTEQITWPRPARLITLSTFDNIHASRQNAGRFGGLGTPRAALGICWGLGHQRATLWSSSVHTLSEVAAKLAEWRLSYLDSPF